MKTIIPFSTQNEQSFLRITLGNHALILEWKHPYTRSLWTSNDFIVPVAMSCFSSIAMKFTAQDILRYSRPAVSHAVLTETLTNWSTWSYSSFQVNRKRCSNLSWFSIIYLLLEFLSYPQRHIFLLNDG